MILIKAAHEFLRCYFSAGGHSEKTRSSYGTDIYQFAEMIGHETDLVAIKRDLILEWLDTLQKRDYASATIRRKIIVVKVFFNHWVRLDELGESPFWRMRIRHAPNAQLPRTIPESEVRRLLTFAKREESKVYAESRSSWDRSYFLLLRNRAILELLFATGLRVGELSRLNIPDFRPADASLRIQGKGGRERLAFVVDRDTVQVLDRYLVSRRRASVETDALFINVHGTRLKSQGIANMITEICGRTGLARRITPHMFRHTVATLLLRNGTDVRLVQEFLGHASISTTQRYTHVSKEHLVRELRANHPSFAMRTNVRSNAANG